MARRFPVAAVILLIADRLASGLPSTPLGHKYVSVSLTW